MECYQIQAVENKGCRSFEYKYYSNIKRVTYHVYSFIYNLVIILTDPYPAKKLKNPAKQDNKPPIIS